MIVTFTANPSIDKTMSLSHPLARGELNRAAATMSEPGGKGINVARCLHAAGAPVTAVLGIADDPLLHALHRLGLQVESPDPEPGISVRVNVTLTEPDGTTTKINEPGQPLTQHRFLDTTRRLLALSPGASWVVLSGSLPPGAPANWYAVLARQLRASEAKIVVDASEEPLRQLAASLPTSPIALLKPNSVELAQLTGGDPVDIEMAAADGNFDRVLEASRRLIKQGVGSVLCTLGAVGAVLTTPSGAWFAQPAQVTVRSTVGAGDASLSGYILAETAGESPAACLARAVAYGCAAASLPGSTLPTPSQVNVDGIRVRQLTR